MITLSNDRLAEQTRIPMNITGSYAAAATSAPNANAGAFKIQNILLPISSLESSQAALRSARWFAEETGAKITILYAAVGGSIPNPRELQDEITKTGGIMPAQLRAIIVCPGVIGHLQVRNAARDEAADLIIIPADFQWGPSHFWQADPMERLVRHSSCPVLIVNNKASQPVSNNGRGRCMQTDEELKQDLLAQLKMKLGGRARDIGVWTANGIVILSGTVPNDADRRAVDAVLNRLNGALAFADDLKVCMPDSHRGVYRNAIP